MLRYETKHKKKHDGQENHEDGRTEKKFEAFNDSSIDVLLLRKPTAIDQQYFYNHETT